MSTRKGLPDTFRSRHSRHYVDSLDESAHESIGQMLPVKKIKINKNQPREIIGDLQGLKTSIKEKGILEPLVVRFENGKYLIISGERRYRAAVELGMEIVPCIIRESDNLDTLEVALIENLQRKDLTPFEEARGLRLLNEKHGLSHDEISKIIGKSRTSVTESLSLNAIPEDIRLLCANHSINAKSMLLQIARQETAVEMLALAQEIIDKGLTRKEAREAGKKTHRSEKVKPFMFRHKSTTGDFNLTIKFRHAAVSKDELISALKGVLEKLERG